jgi:hypothetical protein
MYDKLKDEEVIFLKTVFNFCYQDIRYYNEYKNLKDFKKNIIEQAFEDRQYKNALIQFFYDEKSVITVLSFVTTMIWNNFQVR